jgi:hypothetical protein
VTVQKLPNYKIDEGDEIFSSSSINSSKNPNALSSQTGKALFLVVMN